MVLCSAGHALSILSRACRQSHHVPPISSTSVHRKEGPQRLHGATSLGIKSSLCSGGDRCLRSTTVRLLSKQYYTS